ncbi:MAG: trypsin-like peptidase domain-containing protein [Acidimicrobiia bacterium]|nr:MAG: trypsin-like peptidase domain-containing protein [Acidimicrobiia bacterium]
MATVGILAIGGFFSIDEPVELAAPTTIAAPALVVPPREIVTTGPDIGVAEAVWEKVFPSVVTVEVGTLGENDEIVITASGSGVALEGGYIATNEHVIEGSDVAQIVLQDGRIYEATLVGSDPYTDLAVLAVDAEDLVPVEIGSTSNLAIGQVTIAIGNPLGQVGGASLTVGVLSALSRQVNFDDDSSLFGMLQTDAPITSGSSGGALVDEQGRLIGITTAIGLGDGGAEGIGYAIPVDLVSRVTDELIDSGTVHHAFLGILGGDFVAVADDGALAPSGALVIEVTPADGAAGRAGFLEGDVIVATDAVEIQTMQDLVIQLRLFRVDDTIDFSVLRGDERLTLPVTLDERPDDI